MEDMRLLEELLECESEEAVLGVLKSNGILDDERRWRYLGDMPNNQSIVQSQQSTQAAALVEKITNSQDAILLRSCKAARIDPRGDSAPKTMVAAAEQFFGNLDERNQSQLRNFAESNLVLYATGSKARPCLSLYDSGEGQLPANFQSTFCSLIYGSSDGSYKGAIPFVQGRFNMGGTGVLPFCSEHRKLQLIVSRVPDDVSKSSTTEWGFTLFCFFPSQQKPSWKYLVGKDNHALTAGSKPLRLIPKASARSGEICLPREREVASGTLIKMYDFKAPRSNICGELYKKLQEYLLRPTLPLRVIECRPEYKANVMGVTLWDRLSSWGPNKLEPGFEEGASISIRLDSGETVPGEIRVFKSTRPGEDDENLPQTGLRALINGQSHAKRDVQFFKTKSVDKEHIAGSMLVTLDCTDLGQESRNALFMSNRETFREDPLLAELLKKLQRELSSHEGLIELNRRRYEEKVRNAVDDEEGISALEQLLTTDPALANLFGSAVSGRVGAKSASDDPGTDEDKPPTPFVGTEFPTFFKRKDGSTSISIQVPRGQSKRASFLTDVGNNYFTRRKRRGVCTTQGDTTPTFRLFNGRLTFSVVPEKSLAVGTAIQFQATISDNVGSGPFTLNVKAEIIEPLPADPPEPRPPISPKSGPSPSRPNIKEVAQVPDAPPLTIEKVPGTDRLQLVLNTTSTQLEDAKKQRPKEEEVAVSFVFKYGLALAAMGLIENAKKTPEWANDESAVRSRIEETIVGLSRVMVPLCLSLPRNLPKKS